MWQTLRLVISYLWFFGASLLVPVALWYVLERVTDRTDVMMVSIGGILYASIAQAFFTLQSMNNNLMRYVEKRTLDIQMIVDEELRSVGVGDRLQMTYLRESIEFHQNLKIFGITLIGSAFLIYCIVRLVIVI